MIAVASAIVRTVSRLMTAWPMVVWRSLAHWRLLSGVVIGVTLAAAVMAGSVLYFDSLRELALRHAIRSLPPGDEDVVVRAKRAPTSSTEYAKVAEAVSSRVDSNIGWMLDGRLRGGRSATFYLSSPGVESEAGESSNRSYFVFLPGLTDQITVRPGGTMPVRRNPAAGGERTVLEAAIPEDVAERFGLGVGDRLSAVPYWTDATRFASVEITSVFVRKDPKGDFWRLDDVFASSTTGPYDTLPLYVDEQVFMESVGAAFPAMASRYAWLLSVDTARLNSTNAAAARAGIVLLNLELSSDVSGYGQETGLNTTLEDYDRRLFFSKIPMFMTLVLIAVVILYYVVTLSSLLVDQQRGELALLRSRGASSVQILTVFVIEGLTISAVAVTVAPLVAAVVISALGYTPVFSDLSGGDRLPVAISRSAYLMSGLGGLLSFAALMIPAVQASRLSVTRHRQQSSRPGGQPLFQRYYVDVLLLLVGLILFRQLSEQGSVVATGIFGDEAVSQVLLAVPAVILVGLAMVLLRLFPLAIRFLNGDAPTLSHLTVGGTVVALVPSIVAVGVSDGEGLGWMGQVSLLAALVPAYWLTDRTEALHLKLSGMAVQGGLIALLLLVGPDLPMRQVFMPMAIAIVPMQVAYLVLRAFSLRAPAGYTMGLWQMARNPAHYSRLALLLILMSGLGIFAASFGGTLQLSFDQRALYSTGADVRLENVILNDTGATVSVVERYGEFSGVGQVARVIRASGSDLSKMDGEPYTMVAVDQAVVGDIGWFRDDFATKPTSELLVSLRHKSTPIGIVLPEDAVRISITVKPERPYPGVQVDARLRDVNDRYFTYPLGTLESGDWTELKSPLERPLVPLSRFRFGRVNTRLVPTPPLTLVSLSVHQVRSAGTLSAGSLTLDEIQVDTPSGTETVESFGDISRWNVMRVAPEAIYDILQPSTLTSLGDPANGDSGAATFAWVEGGGLISRGVFSGPLITPLPVLATTSFLKDTGHSVGDEFNVSVAGHRVPVELISSVDYFPTLDTVNDRFLISDLDSVVRYTNLDARGIEVKPNEVWLSTDVAGINRERLIADLDANRPFPTKQLHDRQLYLAESQVDPLVDAGWGALLFIAFGAVLVLSCMGFLVHAYVSFRSREAEFALMRTMGFSMRQLVTLVWLEQALVIAAGMALGTWMGGRLGATIMPFLGNDERGDQILPPFVLEVNWGTLALTYVAMVLVFGVITAGVIWFVRRISLQRILRLGDA